MDQAVEPQEQTSGGERLRRRLEGSVRRYMDAEALWPADGRLLVAVSGGPDSTALLLLLARLGHAIEITAAYFDHQLRGSAAAGSERAAVEALARSAGVELVSGSGDVSALARAQRLSLEEAARRARYDFLSQAASKRGCGWVAVGHTADDQAETVLMHLLRGAGLTGLAGMAPRSRWPAAGHDDLTLVRPLLRLSRRDTEAYCLAAGVRPVEDVSNRSAAYLRNRVRNEALPYLRQYNRRLDGALNRLADAARSDLAYIESVAAQAVQLDSGRAAVSRARLRDWTPSLRRHALRLALLSLVGDLQGFSERHLGALDAAAVGGRTGARLDLPRGLVAVIDREIVELRRGQAPVADTLPADSVRLPVPGEVQFGPWLVAAGGRAQAHCTAAVEIDAAAAGSELRLRRRRPGDRFQPLGLAGTKKLQDFLVDAHVPRQERDSLILFEGERGIVWVGGMRIAQWARPSAGRPVLVLSYRPASTKTGPEAWQP